MKKTVKSAPPVTLVSSESLTATEQRLIRAFRNLKDSAQSFILDTSEDIAKDPEFQRRAMKSSLRLVSGGAA